MIKSVLVKCVGGDDHGLPSLREMAANPKGRRNKIPFLGLPRNVGSTTHWNPRDKTSQQYSFGRPLCFLRFNFTSVISDVPYVQMDWVNFTARAFHRTTFEGHVSEEEWNREPNEDTSGFSPFVAVDEILPSRFVLAYRDNLDIGFLSLDPERVGDTVYDGQQTDMGDDILQYKGGNPVYTNTTIPDKSTNESGFLIHPNVKAFLKADM